MSKKMLSAQVRAIGEHYVLSRVLSLGFVADLAPENTKNIDIIGISEDGNKSLQVQVKTRTKGRSSDEGWHMQEKHESIVGENLFYIFVSISPLWKDKDQPETYVIPSKKVSAVLKRRVLSFLQKLV